MGGKVYRVILYGAGGFLADHFESIASMVNTKVVGICDSNEVLFGENVCGFIVTPFQKIDKNCFDFIVITSLYAYEIECFLLSVGIKKEVIKRFDEYLSMVRGGKLIHYSSKNRDLPTKKSILIITVSVVYANGATMAAYYLLLALKEHGYSVAMAAKKGEKSCIQDFVNHGISIFIDPNLEFKSYDHMEWMKDYRYLIVNTYTMSNCIRNLLYKKKLIWWIHEADYYYEQEIRTWGVLEQELFKQVDVYCVSCEAQKYFKKYYPDVPSRVMEYGIPDECCGMSENNIAKRKKLVFALIGEIYELKGQDLFIDAIEGLKGDIKECEFWVIGKQRDTDYCRSVLERASQINNIKVFEEQSHGSINTMYEQIDVLVSASRRDMLPIVVSEALMHGKLCILPDNIGTVEYLVPGRDAIVYKACDTSELRYYIKQVIDNPAMVTQFKENAKSVYNNYFSMNALSSRIDAAIKRIE